MQKMFFKINIYLKLCQLSGCLMWLMRSAASPNLFSAMSQRGLSGRKGWAKMKATLRRTLTRAKGYQWPRAWAAHSAADGCRCHVY